MLREVLKTGITIDSLIVQDIWWKKLVIRGYSPKYWIRLFLDRVFRSYAGRYYTIMEICGKYNLTPIVIKDINDELEFLKKTNPDLLVVVGSRIIKKHIIEAFPKRIVNFHTGILPQYRGPYSEFWATYNNDEKNIGTTVHFIDLGIDTGDIIKQRYLDKTCDTPELAHIENVANGARLLAECLVEFDHSPLISVAQDNSLAHYYSYPSDQEFSSLTEKLGKSFSIDFSE